jgi:prepilin-type N-terminal cleavage/methylation domain-containing protein
MTVPIYNVYIYIEKQRNSRGITLIELLIVLVIFSMVMAGLYSAYTVNMKQAVKEYRIAESSMELQIAKSVIERDLAMAGFGLADNYNGLPFAPVPIAASDGNPDILTLMGTALARESRASQSWSYATTDNPVAATDYHEWIDSSVTPSVADGRENLQDNDRVIYIEPNEKRLLLAPESDINSATSTTWLFVYPPSGNPATVTGGVTPDLSEPGSLVFGLHTASGSVAQFPYYVVSYSLGGTPPRICAPNTQNLLRGESRLHSPPASSERQPLVNCVRDFQVAFGLDQDENGSIDCWDSGGGTAAVYTTPDLKRRLIQVRVYVLVQEGNYDASYLFTNPDSTYAANRILVGESALMKCGGAGLIGREITLSEPERKYRWRVITLSAAPRNLH